MGKIRKIAGVVFLVLYLCHHISCNYFYHTHHFNWGTVTHSHPFFPFDSPSKHTHTPSQCSLISFWTNQGHLTPEPSLLPAIICGFWFIVQICRINRKKDGFYLSLPGRSPPVY